MDAWPAIPPLLPATPAGYIGGTFLAVCMWPQLHKIFARRCGGEGGRCGGGLPAYEPRAAITLPLRHAFPGAGSHVPHPDPLRSSPAARQLTYRTR